MDRTVFFKQEDVINAAKEGIWSKNDRSEQSDSYGVTSVVIAVVIRKWAEQ